MQIHRTLSAVLIVALAGAFPALHGAAQSTAAPAAIVNGQPITEAELNKAAAADLAKLDTMRFASEAAFSRARLEILHKTLNGMIEDRLLAAEAAKRGSTVADVIHVDVETNVEPPSDQEVNDFYEKNKAQIPIPKEQALPRLREYMMDQVRSMYRGMLMRQLTRTYGVKVLIDPLRTEVASAGFPTHGPANAPITIVEFADFECPHCGAMFPVLKEIEKNYADKVRVVYRQFPLTNIHPHAQKAAEASLCANEQNRFWDFHESLFTNQQDLTIEALKKRAVDLKLDTNAFNACLDSGKQAAAVEKDLDDGDKAGVGGTPTLFINGRLYSGTSYPEVREVIEDELQRLAKKP
ncbi:MAG TPA: thioredoxin domain-containing protein [Terriglobia bacterium]|nr:thioredoxin domain-containing protein [Terriglobia bacterium]